MKEVLIISGKGGTGKTSVAGSLAVLSKNKIMVDCDVDAANLHLLLKPVVVEKKPFYGMSKAVIRKEKCLKCDLCVQLCEFGAIRGYKVNLLYCEGCTLCSHICPCGAIDMVDHEAGHLFVSRTRYGDLVHARLEIAEGNSGKLVAEIRKKARELAEKKRAELVISDGPPGIGCPVIACMSGVDLALVVTEPSLSGRHDLERVVGLAGHFQVNVAVCINKCDLSPQNAKRIKNYCEAKDIPVIGEIPYDNEVVYAVKLGIPVVQHFQGPASKAMANMWERLVCELFLR